MKKFLLAGLITLSACQTAPPDSDVAITWRCANGASFTVDFDEQAGLARVWAGGQTYTLPSAISASGVRYAARGVEFWEHQGEATLTGVAGGPYETCRVAEN